jgi:hypothetical protein
MKPRFLIRVLMAASLLSVACGDGILEPFPRACTEIGCASRLEITFSKPLAYPFTVELTTNDGVTHTRTCTADNVQCRPTLIQFSDLSPVTAVVKIIMPTGTTTANISPQYTTTYPNGRDCPPACFLGTATITL